jgi:hypothetical protein
MYFTALYSSKQQSCKIHKEKNNTIRSKIDISGIIVGDFNNCLSTIGRPDRKPGRI